MSDSGTSMHVLMCNDFPLGVYSTEEKAHEAKTRWLQSEYAMNVVRNQYSTAESPSDVFHLRVYSYELDGEPHF